ncbi:MAG: hypothetical protein AABZ74_08955 [Cyanobacteriota bacterium]
MDKRKDLGSYLEKFQNKDNSSSKSNVDLSSSAIVISNNQTKLDTYQISRLDKDSEKGGLINKIRLRNIEKKYYLEEKKLILDCSIETIKHKVEATQRESEAYWNAKSVEVAETIKTYVQSTIRFLENERLTSKNQAIIDAYERTNDELEKRVASNMSEFLKEQLIEELLRNLKNTVERLRNDAIACKYNLAD